jgi:YfiH family protein
MSLPPVPDSFRWTNESWGAALRCVPMEAAAPHLFSSRQLTLTGPANSPELAAALDADRVAMVAQVHGRRVVVIRDAADVPAVSAEADALISIAPRIAVAVRAADCVPLLLADPITGAVGAVHAGWRGTAAGIAAETVETLRREFGVKPENLLAAIGPSVGPCCYDVGSDLVDAFAAAGHERHLITRWFATPPPPRGSHARPALRLDVAGANRDQLVLAGVPESRIFLSHLCTAMHLDVLTSYRAEKEHAVRIAGAIRAPQSRQG